MVFLAERLLSLQFYSLSLHLVKLKRKCQSIFALDIEQIEAIILSIKKRTIKQGSINSD